MPSEFPAHLGDSKVVWIASYPKSGNTWVRFLLYQYIRGKAESSAAVSGLIPDQHVMGDFDRAAPIDGTLLAKTHFEFGERVPYQDRTRAYIYVVRSPRDTILSCLNYSKLTTDWSMHGAGAEEKYVRVFLRMGCAPEHERLHYGALERHYASWLDEAPFPGMLVRYEDLKSRPARELTRMLEFLGITPDPGRVAEAVKLSGFENMRAMEVREKTSGKSRFVGGTDKLKKGLLFMNKGQTGRSLEPIAKGLDAAVAQRFAAMITRFGY